jgi:uncharacterized membrane protein YccC
MELGLFVLGLLMGGALAWYLLERQRNDASRERDAAAGARARHLQDEVKQADSALAETRDRLIALQLEHKALEERAQPLEAEAAQAKRAAQQALEMETRLRQTCQALQDELAQLKRQLASRPAEPAPSGPAQPAPAPVETLAAPAEPVVAAAAGEPSPAAPSKAGGTKRRGGRARS